MNDASSSLKCISWKTIKYIVITSDKAAWCTTNIIMHFILNSTNVKISHFFDPYSTYESILVSSGNQSHDCDIASYRTMLNFNNTNKMCCLCPGADQEELWPHEASEEPSVEAEGAGPRERRHRHWWWEVTRSQHMATSLITNPSNYWSCTRGGGGGHHVTHSSHNTTYALFTFPLFRNALHHEISWFLPL